MSMLSVNVNQAIEDTRAFLQRNSISEAEHLDLSYITEDLLKFYALYAQPTDIVLAAFVRTLGFVEPCRSDGIASGKQAETFETYYWYGHHVVFHGMAGTAEWTNAYMGNGPNHVYDACNGHYAHTGHVIEASMPIVCKSGSAGFNTMARGFR